MLNSVWWIESTEKCNLHCRFCYNSWRDEPTSKHRDIPQAELLKVLELIATEFQTPKFILSGGDISVSENFEPLVIQVAKLGRTGLVTNGEKISIETLRRIYSYGLSDIQFSVHSHKEDVHRFLTGGGDLRSTIITIKNAISIGMQASIVIVLTEKNIDDVYGVIYLASQLGVPNVVINPLVDAGRAKRYEQSLTIRQNSHDINNFIASMQHEADSLHVHLSAGAPFYDTKLNKLINFSLDRTKTMKLVIDTDLNIKPCSSASLSFGNAINLVRQPKELIQQYLQFWKNPPAFKGCTCAELVRQQHAYDCQQTLKI